jgi:PBSX family phage terminase large subunit
MPEINLQPHVRKHLEEKLIELKRIKDYKEKNKIELYNTGEIIHEKQVQFHKCLKRNRWVFGGNRTGKTECGAVEAIWYARGNHPYKKIPRATNGWVVSVSNEVQRDVVQKKLLAYLNPDWIEEIVMRDGSKDAPESGIIDFIKIKSIKGGLSTIGFKSCEQGRGKFQGSSQDWIWFDEEPPKDIYDECRMRIIDVRGQIWGTMTPLMGLTWVYDEIYIKDTETDPNVWWMAMSWDDNPFLSKAEIKELEKSMTAEERQMRQHGNFVALTGRVYKEFNPSIHVIEPFDVPHEWYCNMSIDPGLEHPLACLWFAVDEDKNIYVIQEHYNNGESVEWHSDSIKQKCKVLEWYPDSKGYYRTLIDSAATARVLSAQKSVVQLFYEHKILCNPKVNKEKFVGISRVKWYLQPRLQLDGEMRPKLFIFNTCRNLINEFNKYVYKEGSDEPIKENDHALDALRYFIMSNFEEYRPPQVAPSQIEADKAKLAKKSGRSSRQEKYINLLKSESEAAKERFNETFKKNQQT